MVFAFTMIRIDLNEIDLSLLTINSVIVGVCD